MVLFQPLLAPGNQLMGGKLAELELVDGGPLPRPDVPVVAAALRIDPHAPLAVDRVAVRGRDDIGAIKSEQLIPGCRATVNEVLAGRRSSGARTYRRRPIVRPLQARQRPRLRSSVR